MKYYFESLFNENLTFVLGWEAFVLFMLLMFISIIVRLNRIEKKTNVMQSYLDDIIEELENE
tara:strand:+ start:51 stop:236 length:186 start_codon:yes stop_codon:yes gene_type:complete